MACDRCEFKGVVCATSLNRWHITAGAITHAALIKRILFLFSSSLVFLVYDHTDSSCDYHANTNFLSFCLLLRKKVMLPQTVSVCRLLSFPAPFSALETQTKLVPERLHIIFFSICFYYLVLKSSLFRLSFSLSLSPTHNTHSNTHTYTRHTHARTQRYTHYIHTHTPQTTNRTHTQAHNHVYIILPHANNHPCKINI